MAALLNLTSASSSTASPASAAAWRASQRTTIAAAWAIRARSSVLSSVLPPRSALKLSTSCRNRLAAFERPSADGREAVPVKAGTVITMIFRVRNRVSTRSTSKPPCNRGVSASYRPPNWGLSGLHLGGNFSHQVASGSLPIGDGIGRRQVLVSPRRSASDRHGIARLIAVASRAGARRSAGRTTAADRGSSIRRP